MIKGACDVVAIDGISKYLYEDEDRHGNPRLYFRKRLPQVDALGKTIPANKGKFRKVRLHEKPGTPEFAEEFRCARDGLPYVGSRPKPAGPAPVILYSLRWLIEQKYYKSNAFRQLEPSTQDARRNILTSICEEPVTEGDPQRIGDLPYQIPAEKIEVLRDRKADFPHAANGRVKCFRYVFQVAMAAKPKLMKSNPANEVEFLKSKKQGGHHPWTVPEILLFCEKHPAGTKAYMALWLFLLTGQRLSDIATLGKQHILRSEHVTPELRQIHAGRWLQFTQYKNRNSKPVTLQVPILPQLEEVFSSCADVLGDMSFLETEWGKPHSIKGLGNWFGDQCVDAGVPGRAHGLRKAGAVIAAERGATAHQLMAIYGWSTLQQAEVYTRQADQKRLAGGAMALLNPPSAAPQCDPPQIGVLKSGSTGV